MGGEDEAEWLVKDISTCVLSGDPECALTWGEVTATNVVIFRIVVIIKQHQRCMQHRGYFQRMF